MSPGVIPCHLSEYIQTWPPEGAEELTRQPGQMTRTLRAEVVAAAETAPESCWSAPECPGSHQAEQMALPGPTTQKKRRCPPWELLLTPQSAHGSPHPPAWHGRAFFICLGARLSSMPFDRGWYRHGHVGCLKPDAEKP
jgi:hypothetical protein